MMKRFVSFLFFAGVFLLAVALVGPGFVDWNSHKDVILSRLQPYVSRKIEVAGNVGFRILPNPRILLEKVEVDQFLTLDRLEANIRFKPLLEGRVEIESVNLVKPDIALEVPAGGKPSWADIFVVKKAERLSRAADAIRLEQLTVSDATLRYKNAVTGVEGVAENLNLKIAADTLRGPYRISGDMKYNGHPVSIDIGTGRYDAKAIPVPVHIALLPAEGLPQISFNGVADMGGALDMQGDISVTEGRLSSLLTDPFFQGLSFMNDIANINGALELKGGAVSLAGLKAKFGKTGEASGKIRIQLAQGQKPEVNAELALQGLTVDDRHGFVDVPQSFTARFDVTGKNISWHGMTMPGLTLGLDTQDMNWSLRKAEISAPGEGAINLAGVVMPEKFLASLSLKASSADVGKTLAALGFVDKPLEKMLPAVLALTAKMEVTPEKIALGEIDARLDSKVAATGSGEIGFAPGVEPVYAAKLKLQGQNILWHGLEAEGAAADMDISCKGLAGGACSGAAAFMADTLKVPGFSPSTLAKALAGLKKKPENVQKQADESLRKDGTVYKNVAAEIRFAEGKVSVDHMQLADDISAVDVSATLSDKYDLSADITLKKPPSVPVLHLTHAEGADYAIDAKPLVPWVEKKFPPPPPQPKAESKDINPIGGILERLEEVKEKPVPSKPDFIGPPAPGAVEETDILPSENDPASGTTVSPVPAGNTPAQTP